MKSYTVAIAGTTPLLLNKPSQYGFDAVFVEKFATPDYDAEFMQRFYTDASQRICLPAIQLERSLVEASKKLKVKGSRGATYSKLFGSMVTVSPDLIPHRFTEYKVHKALVVIPATKGRIMRQRPMLEKWEVDFVINAESEIDSSVIGNALELAGKYCGVGDWRPSKGGKFGKFQVLKFD